MEHPRATAHDGWEYLVIHLNVEPPRPAETADPARKEAEGGEEAAPAKPVFSESFLKKEFPQFYEARSPQEAANQPQQPLHPAQQLQQFLNGHGAQGWELIGVFPVGTLSMLFFRRPRRSETPAAGPTAAEQPAEAESGRDAALEAVLERLSALEQRLAASPSPARGPRGDRGSTPSAQEGRLLTASQLQALSSETPMPASEAAPAIGLRSAASLANHGARHGYRPGLCKLGSNGMAAIYSGSGPSPRGGKIRRLWIVVPADRLRD